MIIYLASFACYHIDIYLQHYHGAATTVNAQDDVTNKTYTQ
jgi:hypothetical protein